MRFVCYTQKQKACLMIQSIPTVRYRFQEEATGTDNCGLREVSRVNPNLNAQSGRRRVEVQLHKAHKPVAVSVAYVE